MANDLRKEFVLLASPRSGSTWLVSLLNQVENTQAFGELFLRRKRAPGDHRWDADFAYPRYSEVEPQGINLRPVRIFAYLDALYRQPGSVGFKLMYSHLRKHPELLAYFLLHRVRVIHLVRRNSLDIVISQVLKRKLERSHLLADQKQPEEVQIELNTRSLVRRLTAKEKGMENMRKLLRWSGLPVLEIAYEDLSSDPSCFASICSFLSIQADGKIPQSNFVKMRQRGHAQIIRNYPEVKETLAGTPYAHFVE